jgi:hypothetical protein
MRKFMEYAYGTVDGDQSRRRERVGGGGMTLMEVTHLGTHEAAIMGWK